MKIEEVDWQGFWWAIWDITVANVVHDRTVRGGPSIGMTREGLINLVLEEAKDQCNVSGSTDAQRYEVAWRVAREFVDWDGTITAEEWAR